MQPVLLPPQTPVALVPVPEPQGTPLVEQPSAKLPAVPMAQSGGKPKKVNKRSKKVTSTTVATAAQPVATSSATQTKKPAEAPAIAAGAPPAKTDNAVAGIGALTVGGEQSPRALQEANELIASNDRRLNGLSADAVKAQAELVAKVRNFQKEAQVALASGDAEGAETLATKGKLLLDDFDKAEAN